MELTVHRFNSNYDATLSVVCIDDHKECLGLEDEHREFKIDAETRIPAGRYKVGIRDTGGFHARYSARFPDFHKGMLQVLDVPNFKYVLIHIGNTDEDTAGCLLVGEYDASTDVELRIGSSAKAYEKLYKKVIDEALAGNLWITYYDED